MSEIKDYKKERIGQTNINNEGYEMEIIDYHSANEVIVVFKDKYKGTSKGTYHSFKHGLISNPNHYKNIRIGEISKNNQGTDMKIIDYYDRANILIEFQDDYKYKTITRYDIFKKGEIKNPYDIKVCGIGRIGNTNSRLKDGTIKKSYECWREMIRRCYDEKSLDRCKAYIECTVCDEWLIFENFEKWFDKNYYEIDGEKIELDKDIIDRNNQIYCPNKCLFVPHRINSLFIKCKHPNKDLGVQIIKPKNSNQNVLYQANVFGKYLGCSSNKERVYNLYIKAKEDLIHSIAEDYKEKIPNNLYEILKNYIYE